jgi:hypothetical protein
MIVMPRRNAEGMTWQIRPQYDRGDSESGRRLASIIRNSTQRTFRDINTVAKATGQEVDDVADMLRMFEVCAVELITEGVITVVL